MKEITDLGLIAALIVLGYNPVKRVKRGRQVVFIFSSDELDGFDQTCQDYFNHRLAVDAFNMHMTLKQVKSSIYQLTEDR